MDLMEILKAMFGGEALTFEQFAESHGGKERKYGFDENGCCQRHRPLLQVQNAQDGGNADGHPAHQENGFPGPAGAAEQISGHEIPDPVGKGHPRQVGHHAPGNGQFHHQVRTGHPEQHHGQTDDGPGHGGLPETAGPEGGHRLYKGHGQQGAQKGRQEFQRASPQHHGKESPARPDQKISSRAGRGFRMVFSSRMAMVSWKLFPQVGMWKLMSFTSLMRVRSVPRWVTRYIRLAPSMVSSPIMIREGVQKAAMVVIPPSRQIRSMVSSTR